jgi:hypothetical protein
MSHTSFVRQRLLRSLLCATCSCEVLWLRLCIVACACSNASSQFMLLHRCVTLHGILSDAMSRMLFICASRGCICLCMPHGTGQSCQHKPGQGSVKRCCARGHARNLQVPARCTQVVAAVICNAAAVAFLSCPSSCGPSYLVACRSIHLDIMCVSGTVSDDLLSYPSVLCPISCASHCRDIVCAAVGSGCMSQYTVHPAVCLVTGLEGLLCMRC